jgi:hypothetical protein
MMTGDEALARVGLRRIDPAAEGMIARIEQAIVKMRAGVEFAAVPSPCY